MFFCFFLFRPIIDYDIIYFVWSKIWALSFMTPFTLYVEKFESLVWPFYFLFFLVHCFTFANCIENICLPLRARLSWSTRKIRLQVHWRILLEPLLGSSFLSFFGYKCSVSENMQCSTWGRDIDGWMLEITGEVNEFAERGRKIWVHFSKNNSTHWQRLAFDHHHTVNFSEVIFSRTT